MHFDLCRMLQKHYCNFMFVKWRYRNLFILKSHCKLFFYPHLSKEILAKIVAKTKIIYFKLTLQ